MRVHLDTDFGGDTDDAGALAYLLGRPDVELVGITTVADHDGLRAAYVRHLLRLAGRDGVPVAAGAAVSLTTGERADPVTGDPRHWPDLPPDPGRPGAALDLLDRGVAAGASVVGIGPFTNLAPTLATLPSTLAAVQDATLAPTYEGEVLRFVRDPAGAPTRVVTAVDGGAFAEHWLSTVERI